MKRTLVIMVKEPRPGRVKTRLGRDIGVIPATWWFRHQSARLIRRLRDPRWQIVLAVAPDRAVASKVWPADLPRQAQGDGDLGQRMKRMLRTAPGVATSGPAAGRAAPGPPPGRAPTHLPSDKRAPWHVNTPVCLIGADIPAITRAHIARAFAALGDHDAVFGPAADGGYWLVGAKHPSRLPQSLFGNTRWSTGHALADTLQTLPGWRIALTDTLHDVDTGADLPQR
ncbi:TIGR04282 family arsenosugar biosynthesis glycosyltransferase [Leisingera thetidis]|uniref:TIGR04282 family arsenosugar biosynthesis glycosyltransferase n=1 Tax=Leisingera thetidis TaxID=2930199 RepID=UPI0021F71314|nr:TIGR04282 family arsenosugar biosynthesis glycosyltransferase [Leisingera thetidis]